VFPFFVVLGGYRCLRNYKGREHLFCKNHRFLSLVFPGKLQKQLFCAVKHFSHSRSLQLLSAASNRKAMFCKCLFVLCVGSIDNSTKLTPLRASLRARYDAGRLRRDTVPLEAHVEVASDADRTDPLAILAQQDKSRLPELIPLRYGRMSRTPFTFLRGAAAVMASDLAALSRTDLGVELCGDAHLGNFRWYRAPNREQAGGVVRARTLSR